MTYRFCLNGPLIHSSVRTLLDEGKLDFSDVAEKPAVASGIQEALDQLTRTQRLALAEACLERVSLSIFVGCLKQNEVSFDQTHPIAIRYSLDSDDYNAIQNIVDLLDGWFEKDPLPVFVALRSGVIDIHPLTYYVQYFYLAYLILLPDCDVLPIDFDNCLVTSKFLYLYASVLVECCLEVKLKIERLSSLSTEALSGVDLERHIEFRLVLANSFLIYSDIANAIECCDVAKRLCGVEFSFEGELGKRTYHQIKDLPQLFAKASLENTNSSFSPGIETDDVPIALKLDNDTVMAEIKRTAESSTVRPDLYPVHMACMMTSLVIMQRNEAPDEILFEKTEAFVSEILSYRKVYGVQLRALLARCKNECDKTRKVERAVMQAEALKNDLLGVHSIDGRATTLTLAQYRERLPWLFASNAKPFWFYLRSYAAILLTLGSVGEALRAYSDIYDYDSLVECYISIGQSEKAETMIRNLISIKETSYRLCLLGDITKDTAWYERAIDISKDNSAKARTALGMALMRRGQLDAAFEHLQRAVQIQPLQTSTLFSLGHVAYKLEKYADAVSAYRKCVNVEPGEFESWNNLSASFVHLKRPEQAQRTMKEALKYNRNHPEMWRNYAIMSINVADYAQAIVAVNEYMNCAKKLEISEVVQQLLLSIIRNHANFESLKKEAIAMMGHLSSKTFLDADVLACYALLKKPAEDCQDVTAFEAYLSTASKAVQKCISSTPWKSDKEAMFNALQLATDMLIVERRTNELLAGSRRIAEHPSRVTSVVKTARENYGSGFEHLEENDRLRNLLQLAVTLVE